jgi:ribosomal RNA assembly protein
MVHDILVSQLGKIKKAVPLLEQRLGVKISWAGKRVSVSGEEFDSILALDMIRAINFGFDAEDTLLLMNPDFNLHFLNIKEYTRKTKFSEVRSRIIGRNGRAKGTIQELTGSIIVLHDNNVGIIVDSAHLDSVIYAITALIRGSKHANIFAYLEKQNAERRKFDEEDLGLKDKKLRL